MMVVSHLHTATILTLELVALGWNLVRAIVGFAHQVSGEQVNKSTIIYLKNSIIKFITFILVKIWDLGNTFTQVFLLNNISTFH